MKKVLLVVLIAALSSVAVAQLAQRVRPGSDPYTPTKGEWLNLYLNAVSADKFQGGGTILISTRFGFDYKTDEVVVLVTYSDSTPPKMVNQSLEQGKLAAEQAIKIHGWDWVRVRERTQVLKSPD